MKTCFNLACLSLVLLVIGCASEETDHLVVPVPGDTSAVVVVATAVDISLTPPSTSGHSLADNASPVTNEAVVPESDAERRTELADYTEKVYLRWNAALTDYRQKQQRWPGSLQELQQHQPELVSLQPPRGFALKLDQQAGEILVTRASQTRPATGALPPPLAIR